MAEMEERKQAILDQIVTPEAKERLSRIGTFVSMPFLS